ncbi:MAG TPA: IS630 family transposase [Candidatus Dojkabacteria bacterium]|nr:IS630 family transposase [Candidatus Dojkabacteria bacterium]
MSKTSHKRKRNQEESPDEMQPSSDLKKVKTNQSGTLSGPKISINIKKSPIVSPDVMEIEDNRNSPRSIERMEIEKKPHILSLTERAKAYLSHKEGKTSKQISKSLHRDKRVVRRLIFTSTQTNTLEPNNKAKGRWPKGETKLNTRHKEFLKRWLSSKEVNSAKQAWIRLSSIRNLSRVSLSTVTRFIHQLGAFVKPKLRSKVSVKNKKARVKYIKDFRWFDFRKVLFPDESIFQLNSNNIKIFKGKHDPYPEQYKVNPNHKVMVWGGVSFRGKTSLHIVSGRLNGDSYCNLLRDHQEEIHDMFENETFWFLQDGAPCHKKKTTIQFIKDEITENIVPHPAQSPDMNPIELIWARMKDFVERQAPKTKDELKSAILDAWDNIDMALIKNCIQGIKKRMKKILKKKGELLH